jgi:hypothetical protein
VPHLRDAEARFHLIRGDFAAALAGFEQCIELTALDAERRSFMLSMWVAAQGGRAEALLHLGRVGEARQSAANALAICDELGIGVHGYDLVRALALAEAKLGDVDAAVARLDALIATQAAMGVSGLRLGLSHEARARVAIWVGDEQAFEHHARLTAKEYRYGARCPMSVRYEQVLNEARRSGLRPATALPEIEATTLVASGRTGFDDVSGVVAKALADAADCKERALRALRLLCDARASHGGHFYLVRPDGVTLVASHRLAAPPATLNAQVHEHLTHELERSETLTVVVTKTRIEDVVNTASMAEIGGVTYDLLLVAGVVQNVGRVVGVVALAIGDQRMRNANQGQLLAAIAAQLVQAGDSAGISMEEP